VDKKQYDSEALDVGDNVNFFNVKVTILGMCSVIKLIADEHLQLLIPLNQH
jgi:hypothetical protein